MGALQYSKLRLGGVVRNNKVSGEAGEREGELGGHGI